jgi:hypothetical protein
MWLRMRNVTMSGIAAVAALVLLSSACKDSSNSVTGPAVSVAPQMSVAGSWSGNYQPDSTVCAGTPMTATLHQDGTSVTGTLTAPSCGVAGVFIGTLNGNQLDGRIHQNGCLGGGVSGTVGPSGMALVIGDMTKPLVTGDKVWLYGGTASLHR